MEPNDVFDLVIKVAELTIIIDAALVLCHVYIYISCQAYNPNYTYIHLFFRLRQIANHIPIKLYPCPILKYSLFSCSMLDTVIFDVSGPLWIYDADSFCGA